MRLFNASSLFDEDNIKELLKIMHDPEKFKNKLIETKKALLKLYNFKAHNVPDDFVSSSAVIAANHLTDSDAPLVMSFYYETMHKVKDTYPELFIFAKENCFNGVSLPKELNPLMEHEKVTAIDRSRQGGSWEAIKAAKKWFSAGEKPKHFLIFAQGTIYDINKDRVEDIEDGAFWLAGMLGIPVLPAFVEQLVEGAENRLVFGDYIAVPGGCRDFGEYKALWLKRVIGAQNALETLTGTPAREAVLDEDHRTRKTFKPN